MITEGNALQPLEYQVRECFGRVVYSHKVHEKCADLCLSRLSMIKLCQIILSVIVTGSILIDIFGDNTFTKVIGGICSAILLAITTYTKDYDLGAIAQKHREAATKLWDIRESYLSLLTDISMGDKDVEELRKCRDSLQKALATVYAGSPSTNFKAYSQAQQALQINEELTFSTEEIDKFLPEPLRKNSKGS
jgi:hypothetical protein